MLVGEVLEDLPEIYDPDLWARKADAVFDHIFASYHDDGTSIYSPIVATPATSTTASTAVAQARSVAALAEENVTVVDGTEAVLKRLERDPAYAKRLAVRLRGPEDASFAIPTHQLIAGGETSNCEFKSTAIWNLREARKDKRIEDASSR